MRILVTGSNTFYGARLVQGLGATDCAVTAADCIRRSCGKVSRYADRSLDLPPLRSNPSGYLDALLAELREHEYDALLPSFEESIFLADHREALAAQTRCFLPAPGIAWDLHHKGRLYDFCTEHEIPTPPTQVPQGRESWEQVAEAATYPAFVKPAVGLGSLGRSRCESPADTIEAFETVLKCRDGVEPLLQTIVEGDVISTLSFCHEGKVLGDIGYRSLRTLPDDGGISCHRESVDAPDVFLLAERILAAARWTGFVGMDFVVDRATGVPYLLDFNPRVTPALQLGFVAGVDWAKIVTDIVKGVDPEPVRARADMRARSVVFDIGWLIDGFRSGPRRGFGKLREFLRPKWSLDSSIDLVDRRDWRPKVAMFKYAISCIVGSAVRRRAFGDLLFHESTYDRTTAVAVEPRLAVPGASRPSKPTERMFAK